MELMHCNCDIPMRCRGLLFLLTPDTSLNFLFNLSNSWVPSFRDLPTASNTVLLPHSIIDVVLATIQHKTNLGLVSFQ